MNTGYYSFHKHVQHDTGSDHPEHALRLMAIEQVLKKCGLWSKMEIVEGELAHMPDILRAHSKSYVDELHVIQPENGHIMIDEDTTMSSGSLEAALYSVGTTTMGLDALLDHKHRNVFAAIRPPGHHAERNKSMGFCFFNNVAIAALRAAETHHLQRIAVLDFDAHQGNGTIDILQNDQRFLLLSCFQHPFYPYTHHEQNKYTNVVNVHLAAGAGGEEFRTGIESQWTERLRMFAPELILVSAGFDAHEADPQADLNLKDEDFEWIGKWLVKQTDRRKIPWMAVLEGGYDLNALSRSAALFIHQMICQNS